MSYSQFGSIQAIDFNQLCGGNNTLNTTWAVGTGSAGYGQTAIANVNVGDTITASGKWTTLVTNTSNAAIHQGTTISSVTPPVAGAAPSSVITYTSAISTNLQTIYSTRLNASIQGTTVANTATYGAAWQNALTFTFTATFANGDAARYFFNSGGQLKISCSHPAGTGINATFNGLAANVGNVYLSSPTSGTVTIAGNTFSGITKVGTGGNTPSPYLTNNGYYALTTTNTTVFTQTAVSGSSSISYVAKSNGTQGSNADTGSIVTIYAVWDEIPDGLLVSSGSATTLTAIYPESTYIANTWGAVTLSGSVTGS